MIQGEVVKKVFISLILLTAVVVVHASNRTGNIRKQARSFIKHSAERVKNLPISQEAKEAEHRRMVNKGNELHDAMAQDDVSHQESRMPRVKKGTEEHAKASSSIARVITQD